MDMQIAPLAGGEKSQSRERTARFNWLLYFRSIRTDGDHPALISSVTVFIPTAFNVLKIWRLHVFRLGNFAANKLVTRPNQSSA